jgi:hypothetical protein
VDTNGTPIARILLATLCILNIKNKSWIIKQHSINKLRNNFPMSCSVNCRHNARHIRTIPFRLPPDWDGWPLKFTIAHFQ